MTQDQLNQLGKTLWAIADDPDGNLHARLVNILSHGNYSLFEPQEMLPENKGILPQNPP